MATRAPGTATGEHEAIQTACAGTLPAGPPTPIELSPVRALSPGGVIFEDGTAAMFWSAEQLLRPLTGFSGPVELAEGPATCASAPRRGPFIAITG